MTREDLTAALAPLEAKLDTLLEQIAAWEPSRPAAPVSATKRDGRARAWTYVARFWEQTPIGPELIGETDKETMKGTGEIPNIIRTLAAGLHETSAEQLPSALSEDAIKGMLRQFRNNLGRGNHAALRIEYALPESAEAPTEYLCQLDVYRVV